MTTFEIAIVVIILALIAIYAPILFIGILILAIPAFTPIPLLIYLAIIAIISWIKLMINKG